MSTCPNTPDPNDGVSHLYPPGTSPEIRLDQLGSMCSFYKTPRLITGVLRFFLGQHFADPQNVVVDPALRSLLEEKGGWDPDAPGRGLIIESVGKWDPAKMGQRPAIILKAGDWTWRRVGIGDRSGDDYRSGQVYYSGLWNGSHTVFAIAGESAEAELLAAETGLMLLHFGPLLVEHMNLHRFVVVQIGAVSPLKEATENYVVPITVAYVAEEAWSLQYDAPRLKRITIPVDQL